jgi:hypothetical protein
MEAGDVGPAQTIADFCRSELTQLFAAAIAVLNKSSEPTPAPALPMGHAKEKRLMKKLFPLS